MSFRALMAISAEFDLELDQMDAVNAFVNCPLEDENPGEIHQQAADRVILYLYATRSYGIRLGGNMGRKAAAEIFLCSSDASFADNSIDRKSSQGYVMTLFGGPIA
ncbi:hypothetical protein HRG_013495 [Hirsutella rhossiliensis]